MTKKTETTATNRSERGFTLVELLVSLLILAVAMGGITIILTMAMENNSKSSNDTTSTMIAEHILEQLSSQPANSATTLTLYDCRGVGHNITTTGAKLGLGNSVNGGNGANLTPTTAITPSVIDWTQAYANVPAGYRMRYVSCGTGGRNETYDIRWNIITLTNYTQLVVVSARPIQDANSTIATGLRFVTPVNLRTINGM
jgi:prepilin-type N-terminal cleavage/methylation domain-containing protein